LDKVGILATSRKKVSHPAPVIEFYHSPLFTQSVEYAKRNYDRFYFYNTKDGLLLPDDIMYPSDVSIKTLSVSQKQEWANQIVTTLMNYELPESISIYLHGGTIYREFLEPALINKGFSFCVPLKGYSIGTQLKWYKEQLQLK
jgi:hypothetical protein